MLLQVAVVAHAHGLTILYGRTAVGVASDHCSIDCVGTQARTLEFTVWLHIICTYIQRRRKKKDGEGSGKIIRSVCVRAETQRGRGVHYTCTSQQGAKPSDKTITHVEAGGF